MSSYFDNIFEHFDILSHKPEMKIKGRTRFITNFGIIMGTLSIIAIAILSLFFTMDVFSRTKFSIVYNLDSRIYPQVNFKENQIALLLIDAVGKELDDYDRIYSFNAKLWKIEITSKINFNYTSDYMSYVPKNVILDIPFKNCSLLPNLKYKEFFSTFSLVYRSGLCLDFSNFNDSLLLYGKYGGVEGYSTLNIYINRCINSSALNKTNCYPSYIIDKKLSQNFINLITIENDVNSNNFEKPIEPFVKNEILPISSTIFKNYFKEINFIQFNTDNNYILESFEKFESYRTDKIIESVDLRGSNTLFAGTFSQITFRCSGKTEIFSRVYRKIPETFAYIGGILQAITFIGRILLHLWSKNSMMSYLIFNMFDLDEINYYLSQNSLDLKKLEEYNKNNLIITHFNKNKKTYENFSVKSAMKIKSNHLSRNKSESNRFHNRKESDYNKLVLMKNNVNESNNDLKNQGNLDQVENSQDNFFQNQLYQNIIDKDKQQQNKESLDKFTKIHLSENINMKGKKSHEKNIGDNGEKNTSTTQYLKSLKERSEENMKLYSQYINKKKNKSYNFLSFYELICFREMISDKKKKFFLQITSEIIDRKISLEYSLKYFSNFDKLKMILLTKEQRENYSNIPNYKLKYHLEEIMNADKINNDLLS